MNTVIKVEHLTKEYNLGSLTSLKDTLRHGAARILGKNTWSREKFKALNNIDFEVNEGEVLGIIGHNGAGKSTLLKHLAEITRPTQGNVKVTGSVAPLIEVGAGVNPELTGRENIYLNGAILGISKREIEQKIDGIIEFSELGKFIDTPVKRYSSGMTVKLGFSIATSMDADILIIDEVLAVGDLAFQRKCFDRMESLIKRQNKTVILVSHNIRQVQRLCTRVIMMNQGSIMKDGDPIEVCNLFYDQNDTKIKSQSNVTLQNVSSTGEIEVKGVHFENNTGQVAEDLVYNDNTTIVFDIEVRKNLERVTFGFGFHTTDFLYLSTHNSEEQLKLEELSSGQYKIRCKINKLPLLTGVYSLRFGVTAGDAAQDIFYGENLKHFRVTGEIPITVRDGFFALDAHWSVS